MTQHWHHLLSLGIENDVYEDIKFVANGDERKICIGGRIDRMDKIVDKENNTEKNKNC